MVQIYSRLTNELDLLQFASSHNRSTTDAVLLSFHNALYHLDNRNALGRQAAVC